MGAHAYSMRPHPCPAGWKQKTAGMDWLFHGAVSLQHDVVTTPATGIYPSASHFYLSLIHISEPTRLDVI
eukprot:837470-Prorocentrum_lima.AAC.1